MCRDNTEMLNLIAERDGIMLADAQLPAARLIETWAAQLTERQVALVRAYDSMVDRHKAVAIEQAFTGMRCLH